MDGGLRALFQKYLPAVHWQSIETWSTGRGVPDLNGCYLGVEAWIELKEVKGWRVAVSPEQVGWLERRARAGGKVFLAARKDSVLWLLRSSAARLLIGGLRICDLPPLQVLGRYEGGPARWEWKGIEKVLFSPHFGG